MMFESLINRLRGTQETPALPEPDEHLALGALMVRVAKSDQHYDALEIGEIDRLLAESFSINPIEAAKMRATCEKLEAQAPGTPDFALLIRQTVDYPHRLDMIRAFCRVIMADGRKRPEEDEALAEILRIFGIRDEDRPF